MSGQPPLTLGGSADNPPVPLPIWSPAVTETRLLPPMTCPVRQRVDESDSHAVPSHAVPPAVAAALIAPTPMPPPSTCRLADPVTPTLRPPTMRIHPEAADTAAVMLPVWRPAVSKALRLATSEWAARARAAVSDAHVLCSHELRPVLLQAVCAVDPMFSPYTVTSAAPVPPAFDTATALRSVEAAERAPLTLPTPRPTVSDSLTLAPRPDPARHAAAVSAAHAVDSLEVGPRPARALSPNPMPDPCTVTIDAPVAAWLAMLARLIRTWSIVSETVRLAAAALQLVTTTATLPVAPQPTSDRIDVSDTHADMQRLVYPVLPETVCTARPMLMPCMVTLTEPVAPMLGLDITLVAIGSVERAALMLACLAPAAVTCAFLLPIPPRAVRQATHVSDCQLVPSQAVAWPSRPLAVMPATPMLAP